MYDSWVWLSEAGSLCISFQSLLCLWGSGFNLHVTMRCTYALVWVREDDTGRASHLSPGVGADVLTLADMSTCRVWLDSRSSDSAHLWGWGALWFLFFKFNFYFIFRDIPAAYGSSQARGQISQMELPAYITATATRDMSHICDLHCSSW